MEKIGEQLDREMMIWRKERTREMSETKLVPSFPFSQKMNGPIIIYVLINIEECAQIQSFIN